MNVSEICNGFDPNDYPLQLCYIRLGTENRTSVQYRNLPLKFCSFWIYQNVRAAVT
jgi:hypothetical protein